MQYIMLDLAVPLPAEFDRLASLPAGAALDHACVIDVPVIRGGISPEILRFEHFVWILGELQSGTTMSMPYPWTGLLAIRGNLTGTSGRMTILRCNNARQADPYTELFDFYIALHDAASPFRHLFPPALDQRPVVVALRNSAISMGGEDLFFERNKASLAAAAITTMWCQARSPARLGTPNAN